jgi:hypothetical protein
LPATNKLGSILRIGPVAAFPAIYPFPQVGPFLPNAKNIFNNVDRKVVNLYSLKTTQQIDTNSKQFDRAVASDSV